MMSLCTITEIDITETKEEIFKSICKNRFFTVNQGSYYFKLTKSYHFL